MDTVRALLFATMLGLAPATALAQQGMPAADEIVLPGARSARPEARPTKTRPTAAERTRTRPSRRHVRRHHRVARPPRIEEEEIDEQPEESDEEVSDEEDAEAARLEQEGIEYEVQQEVEWEERRRREREASEHIEPAPPPARTESPPGQAVDDEDILTPRAPRHEHAEAEVRAETTPARHRPRAPEPDLLRVEVGVSASTREQVVDSPDGSTIRFGVTPFASAYGSVTATPFARMRSGPTGLGAAVSYDRAIRMEAMAGEQALDASADHFGVFVLYRFLLPGRVRLEPRLGYDLARFLLAPNDTLPGIVYESIALGGSAQIPILRDARTGDDKLRVRLGGALYFPIGLGEAAAKWGQSGSASGFSFEGGLEGMVSGVFGYFALLRYTSYTATFHTATVATGGETESQDGVTTGLCGGSVRF